MDNLTLVIPAKNEKESLPEVLDEIKSYNCKKIVIMEKSDIVSSVPVKILLSFISNSLLKFFPKVLLSLVLYKDFNSG